MTAGPTAGRPADILTDVLSVPLRAAGFELEDVEVRRAGSQSVVAVVVDRDGPVDLDAVADASRIVSETLDSTTTPLPATLGNAYTLEVSSRGADAPLTQPRHWRRAVGRLVEVRTTDGRTLTGRIIAAQDADVVIESVPVPKKPGAKVSAKAVTTTTVGYDQVARAVIQLEFSRPGEPDDLDDEVDDDLDDEEGITR